MKLQTLRMNARAEQMLWLDLEISLQDWTRGRASLPAENCLQPRIRFQAEKFAPASHERNDHLSLRLRERGLGQEEDRVLRQQGRLKVGEIGGVKTVQAFGAQNLRQIYPKGIGSLSIPNDQQGY